MKTAAKPLIYLDHAATSWPKPPQVLERVAEAMMSEAANPGRGSHAMAVKASRALFGARKQLARLFGVGNPNDISFSLNTTAALNLAIKGFLKPGDHVIATAVEHNSVRRPLSYLKRAMGVEVTYIEVDLEGQLDLKQLERSFQKNTTLVVVNHSSNLLGSILPVAEIGEIARSKGARLLVDAAQSAGILDIDVKAAGIDMLAFPGHKGLLGPQGTGGLYLHPDLELEPHMHGGTGSQSEAEEQPVIRPDRYEAGTQNTPGIAGLAVGVQYILEQTVSRIYDEEWKLTQQMIEGLQSIDDVKILGPKLGERRTGIVSFLVGQVDPSEIAFVLDQHYGIAVRSGFHCTPLAHESAGTYATGAVRASVGYQSTSDDVAALVAAIAEMKQHFN
ncbi:aminotransferase class V-fold PLP-dependent enzyme [Paenibacillaceae bacterium]|nr:aminotransferase class V-fold PLP-dependent enzyme [Paenibacillaceae bacterium]